MLDCIINNLYYTLYLQIKKKYLIIKNFFLSVLNFFFYFTSLNEIVKLLSNNSFKLHIFKVAPFSQNYGILKIKSDSGQSDPRTINSLMLENTSVEAEISRDQE